MGEAVFEDEAPFLEQPLRAAAVLCRTGHGNLHAGVLYRDGAQASVLHLGWQDQLDRTWTWERLWAAPDIEPERLMSVAGLCRRIWQRFVLTSQFPYAITFSGTSFDAAGQLVLGPDAQGLTCATFILAIFETMGVTLVNETSWPVREADDKKFLRDVASFAAPAHLAVLQSEVEGGCVRIQPDEVIGACACQLPADFDVTRLVADRVLQRLNARRASGQ